MERKNLATCKPSEFLAQSNKIRKSVENWLSINEIMEIRKNVPELKQFPSDASQDEIDKIKKENKDLLAKRSRENFSKILDNIMDKHPEETLGLLALLCFVDPKNVDDYPVSFYLANVTDILNDENVLNFFTSLVQLGQTGILN